MANTFRSKEVYKKIPKEVHDRNTMVAVYGVYVSGQYRPPYYANNGITISGMSCTKATIVDYEKEYEKTYEDFSYGIYDFDTNMDWGIYLYGTDRYVNNDDFAYGLFDMTTNMDWGIYLYGSDHILAYEDFSYGMCDFDVTSSLTFSVKHDDIYNLTPQPGLRISQISISKATISNA